MSKPIKFRAWDKENEEYRNGYDVLLRYDGSAISKYALGALDTDMPVNVIIEQYTGLKDKNGKEIYEGDIVRLYDGKYGNYIVNFSEHNFAFVFDAIDESHMYWFNRGKSEDAEVIGNIHEAPKDFRPEHLKRMSVSISKGGEE